MQRIDDVGEQPGEDQCRDDQRDGDHAAPPPKLAADRDQHDEQHDPAKDEEDGAIGVVARSPATHLRGLSLPQQRG